MPAEQHFCKIGGIAAIVGILLLMIATFLHPMSADPADELAAFAEYAADPFWIASHLGQLLGVMLITVGLLALSWRLRSGPAGVWAILAAAGAIGSMALSGALQAVDGIALKVMVDRWAIAGPEEQSLLFESAFAVRQIEVGLASIVILLLAVTVLLYAVAIWLTEDVPRLLAWLAMFSSAGMLVSGVMYAYTGFSQMAMTAIMPANLLLAAWVLGVGSFLLRNSRDGADSQ